MLELSSSTNHIDGINGDQTSGPSIAKNGRRYGDLKLIARDSGTNLLETNINTKIDSPDRTRLFGLIQDFTAPGDSQYRNYCERSVGLIKKYLYQACGLEKNEALPVMLKTEMEYLLETAASIVNRIPYTLSKDMVHVCPADTLFVGPKWDYLLIVKSKLRSINDMVSNLRVHKEEMEKIRN